MPEFDLNRRLAAEFIGTMLLLATVVGSGIMAENLAGGNVAIALLGNTVATGAILAVLILIFGAISGAHFNPAVTLAFLLRREIDSTEAAAYMAIQIAGGVAGVWLAHRPLSSCSSQGRRWRQRFSGGSRKPVLDLIR